MIDLHTHILPGVDDGAKDLETSLKMLRMEAEQGVDTVVLTPHFYGHREPLQRFLQRRDAAVAQLKAGLLALPKEELQQLPRLILGCEVAWMPNLAQVEGLQELCMGTTDNLLLELPFTPWDRSLSRQIYDLMGRTGITPVIAHLERYMKLQSEAQIEEILSLGLPVQISADTFLGVFTRRSSLNALESWAHIVASDCHDTEKRRPCLGPAMEVVKKKLGEDAVWTLEHHAKDLITPRSQ